MLSLDWPDLAGTLAQRTGPGPGPRRPSWCRPDERLHNGWSLDHFALPEADVRLAVHRTARATAALTAGAQGKPLRRGRCPRSHRPRLRCVAPSTLRHSRSPSSACAASVASASRACRLAGRREPRVSPVRSTCIGYDGGGGIGSTPGITVGAALGLRGSGRLPVAILGDGDLLMGSQALWTAAAQRLPALFIVNNNRSVLQRRRAPGARGQAARPAGGKPQYRHGDQRPGG